MKHRARVTVGVTGHRWRDDPAGIEIRVRTVLSKLQSLIGPDHELAVVSPLAEGADRLVATVAQQLGARLECVLPFDTAEYERDFDLRESVEQFRRLVRTADATDVLPGRAGTPEERNTAYADAGSAVIARSDLLIAIWDGRASRGRGGTAEIISAARDAGLPVIWLDVSPPHRVRVLTGPDESDLGALLTEELGSTEITNL